MLNRIPANNLNNAVRVLFQPLFDHLGVVSILHGRTPGVVYVDHFDTPAIGVAWFHSRVYLCGNFLEPQMWKETRTCFLQQLLPQMQAANMQGFILLTGIELEKELAHSLLPEYRCIRAMRRHYICRNPPDETPKLPEGFELRMVNGHLFREPRLKGIERLYEEMVSERPSVDDFFEKSFGVALIHAQEVIGWCLSEYNCEGRCEVGVAVAEAYQRLGFGTVLSTALVREAFQCGYHEVGWHCWSENRASAALAERSGFELRSEFPVWYWVIKTAENR